MKNKLLALALSLLWAAPAFAASATGQNIQIGAEVVMGLQSVYPNTLFQYQEPPATTAQFQGSTILSIPPTSTNNTVNTATLFSGMATPILVGIADITNPGVQLSVGLDSGGAREVMAPNGFHIVRVASGFPTFYIDNATSGAALLRVFILSN